jgi:hypothetical protein
VEAVERDPLLGTLKTLIAAGRLDLGHIRPAKTLTVPFPAC